MKFKRSGPLAIAPKALGFDWPESDRPEADGELVGDVAVVTIRGPLTHHCEWFWSDSYDAIVLRAKEAFESSASAVLISCDSPGGDVSGLFDTARELRRMADDSGKTFLWYVDGESCSAAMALACSADHIVVPEEGRIGSIGVIAELWDETEAAAKYGTKCTLITSGLRKADGHPMNPTSKETEAAVQASVDTEAEIFFRWVAERRGIDVAAIEGLQAKVVHGSEGVALGLADEIGTFSEALAMVADVLPGEAPQQGAEQKASAMRKPLTAAAPTPQSKAGKLEDARKALGELAGEDSDEGRRARKMLDAGDEEEKPEDKPEDKPEKEPDGDEGEDEGEDDAAASAEDDEASSHAESGDDAEDEEAVAKAEDEEAKHAEDDAKKCEDDARKAEAEADESDAKARSAKNFAEAQSYMRVSANARSRVRSCKARASQSKANAKAHRTAAVTHRSLAKVHGKLAAVATPTKPKNPLTAKLAGSNAALAARGNATPPKGGAKPPTATEAGRKPIDQIDPAIRRAAGIALPASQDPMVKYDGHGMSIGARLTSPKAAREFLAGKAGA